MSNMSYCRFQNTLPDLQDCYDAMGEKKPRELSFEEQIARRHLVRLCRDIVADYEHEADAPPAIREKTS